MDSETKQLWANTDSKFQEEDRGDPGARGQPPQNQHEARGAEPASSPVWSERISLPRVSSPHLLSAAPAYP